MSDSYLQPSNIHTPQSPRKGRLVGQKPPLKPKEVWSIRIRLQILGKTRDLALFNLAIDSKLRSCDLMALRVSDVFVSGSVKERTVIVQQKTGRPVQFELTEQTREVGALSSGFVVHNTMSVADGNGGSASLAKDVSVMSGNGFNLYMVEGQDPVVPGDQLTYTLRYGNLSGASVANTVLTVPVPAGTSYVSASPGAVYTGSAVQWSLGSLAAGESGEQQLTVSVTGAVDGVIVADAFLEDMSGAVVTQRTQVTTEIEAVAPYLLTLTADRDPVVSGNDNPLIYTLTVRNQGASVLPGVVLRDDIPLGMDVQSAEYGGGTCSGFAPCNSGEYLTWSLGDLAPGESRVVQFTARQVGALSSGFVVHNTMSVADGNGGGASLAKDVSVMSGNGFNLYMVEGQDPVVPGDQLTYTLRYGNLSGASVANTVLTVPVPAGTSYVSASPGAVYTGSAVQWSLGSLAAGESGEQQLTVSVTGAVDGVIVADAFLEDMSGAVVTQRTQVTTEIEAVAPYLLTLTADRDPVVSGNDNPLIYTLTVRNQGASVLPGVVLRDDIPLGMDVQSAEYGGGTCSGFAPCNSGEYLTWSLGDLAPGESRVVQFTARQVGALSSGFVVHNTMSVADGNGGGASLAKDVSVMSGNGFNLYMVEGQDPVVPGDQLTYTLRYGNLSGASVANTVLTVPVPAGTSYVSASPGAVYTGSAVQWSLGSLAAGESGEQQLTVSVTGAVDGVIVADAFLEDMSGAVVTQRTQVTTEIEAVAPYLLTLTADRDPVVSGNDNPLIYTLTVRNQGASVLPGVVLRDDIPLGMDVQSAEYGGGTCSGFAPCNSGEYLTWSLGDLAPGESRVVQFTARQVGALSSGFVVHNTMSVADGNGGSASLAKDVAVVSGSQDYDGDGLSNSLEESIGTSVSNWDTDGDGLSDYQEVAYDGNANSYIAGQDMDPLSVDSDGDGFSDYEEVITYSTDPLDSNSAPVLADGDVNADGVVDVVDVLLAQQIVIGQLAPTQDQLDHGDVAPLVNGVPVPDGLFDLGDLLVIQRKALGLVNF